MMMLRLVAIPTVVVNVICMALAATTADIGVFLIAWAGATAGVYGWIFYKEELHDMGQTPQGFRELALRLRYDITQAQPEPGHKLPSTRELAKSYETTRTTVGRALKILAGDGVVEIVHGRGVYILGPAGHKGERLDKPRDRIAVHLLNILAAQPAGQPMPPTKDLAEQAGASVITVRRVERALLRQGLIRRDRHGRYVKV